MINRALDYAAGLLTVASALLILFLLTAGMEDDRPIIGDPHAMLLPVLTN